VRFRSFGGNLISYQDAGAPQKLVYRNWKQFGPRLGFAYRALDGKRAFVIRGGYRNILLPTEASGLGRLPIGLGAGRRRVSRISVTNTAPVAGRAAELWVALRAAVTSLEVNTPDSIINTNGHALAGARFQCPGLLDPHFYRMAEFRTGT